MKIDEDYVANRKGPAQGSQTGTGLFGSTAQAPLFGGNTSNANMANMSGGNLFGTSGFGQTSVFGQNNIQPNNSLFGKPASTSPFGVTTTTQSTGSSTFGQTSNLFGSNANQAKPAFGNNPAWANAMSKVLNTKKSVNKRAIILSKAKKIANIKEKKPKLEFEIDGEEVKTEPDDEDVEENKPDLKKKLLIKEQQAKGRVKPTVLDRDRERRLIKIATKGVVQLFNAVRQQQKVVDKTIKKAGKSELKREKVLETIDKKKFVDALTGFIKSIPANDNVKAEEKIEENSTWSVLRDDFMMGTKLKDWDKREEVI